MIIKFTGIYSIQEYDALKKLRFSQAKNEHVIFCCNELKDDWHGDYYDRHVYWDDEKAKVSILEHEWGDTSFYPIKHCPFCGEFIVITEEKKLLRRSVPYITEETRYKEVYEEML